MSLRDQIISANEANCAVVSRDYAALLRRHGPSFLVFRGGRVISTHTTEAEARERGRSSFADRLYSIHELTDKPRRVGALTAAFG